MYGGMDATGGPFAKQAKGLGLRAKILGGEGVCSTDLSGLAGAAADNVVCSEAGMALEKMPGGTDFACRYDARFRQPLQVYAPFAHDAVYILIDAMKRANSTDPTKLLAAMPSTDYKGVIGETTFNAQGDLRYGAISVYSYKNGKKSLLDVIRM
jgi:branched-chain amino acid transport system substrate-binding protein